MITWSSNSRRQVPTHRSANGFCQGLRYAVRTGSVPRLRIVAVTSADSMSAAIHERAGSADALVMAAAVADYRPATSADQKIKRAEAGDMTIELAENEDIIASVDKGLYAPNFGGGQVDITSGKFVFSASEAYLIEKGKVTAPIKGAMLIGDGPEALKKISMVGNDLELDSGVGTCGKEGQSVPVGVGQPTLKIDEITVGGTG